MESLFRYAPPPSPCGYLPDRQWSLEHEYVAAMSSAEYLQRMIEGWRRFGHLLFRPACPTCRACRSLRVRAASFRPDRAQRRARRANADVRLRIGEPAATAAKLALYDRYHAFQAERKGWPEHAPRDSSGYADSFITHPFATEEWCYYVKSRLVGVGYVDHLPESLPGVTAPGQEGLSAIYFFYDPEERGRSLGTFNVLSIIAEAARRALPYVYLGYFVEGCSSLEYKARYVPNEARGEDGEWRPFRL